MRFKYRCQLHGKNKVTFLTSSDAQMAAFREKQIRGHDLYVYRCPGCGLFHLTSKKQKPNQPQIQHHHEVEHE